MLIVSGLGGSRFEVVVKSTLQKGLSYSLAFQSLLGGRLVMVRRMRAFAVANEMGHDGVLVVAAAAFASLSAASYAIVTGGSK